MSHDLSKSVYNKKYKINGTIIGFKPFDSYLVSIGKNRDPLIPGFTFTENQLHLTKVVPGIKLPTDIASYTDDKVFWSYGIDLEVSEKLSVEKEVIPVKSRYDLDNRIDGAFCIKCNDFLAYAETGVICWSCKQDPYKFSLLSVDDSD